LSCTAPFFSSVPLFLATPCCSKRAVLSGLKHSRAHLNDDFLFFVFFLSSRESLSPSLVLKSFESRSSGPRSIFLPDRRYTVFRLIRFSPALTELRVHLQLRYLSPLRFLPNYCELPIPTLFLFCRRFLLSSFLDDPPIPSDRLLGPPLPVIRGFLFCNCRFYNVLVCPFSSYPGRPQVPFFLPAHFFTVPLFVPFFFKTVSASCSVLRFFPRRFVHMANLKRRRNSAFLASR